MLACRARAWLAGCNCWLPVAAARSLPKPSQSRCPPPRSDIPSVMQLVRERADPPSSPSSLLACQPACQLSKREPTDTGGHSNSNSSHWALVARLARLQLRNLLLTLRLPNYTSRQHAPLPARLDITRASCLHPFHLLRLTSRPHFHKIQRPDKRENTRRLISRGGVSDAAGE